jgi:uncharacterized delta-60 repeat protein
MKKNITLLLALCYSIHYSQNLIADSTFNGNGMAIATSESTSAYGNSLLYQPDGKIVVVGHYQVPHPIFYVSGFLSYRFNSNGTHDTFCGDSSRTRTKFYPLTQDNALATALQTDGKIIMAGVANTNLAMARYRPNGIIDSTFGTNGKVESLFGAGQIKAIILLNNGSILVVGKCAGGFAVVKYLTSGIPDVTFGNNGIVLAGTNLNNSEFSSIAVQPDGKIVASGQYWYDNTNGYDMAVMRFNSNGSVDNSFGTNGLVAIDFGSIEDYCYKVHIRANGKLVMTGITKLASGKTKFAAAELLSSGALSTSFGNGGKTIENSSVDHNFLSSSILLSNNEILMCGDLYVNGDFLKGIPTFMKIGSNGQFNYSFGSNGYFHPIQSYNRLRFYDMILQPDGKLIACGIYIAPNSGPQLMVARYKFVAAPNTTNIQDENLETNMSVFPNPATDKLFINTGSLIEFSTSLYNSTGKLVYQNFNTQELDISTLPSGIYFLVIRNKNNELVKTANMIKN